MPEFITGRLLPIHKSYRAQRTARDFWQRSDRAKYDYPAGQDAAGRLILPKHEREMADRYERRKNQAIVRRYARPIIDRYNDFVTREPAKRPDAVPGSPYALIRADADGNGCPLEVMMKRVLRTAQVDGVGYMLCDASVSGVFESAAAEQAAGNRPLLRVILADQVVWWRCWQGALLEAVILLEDQDGKLFAWYVNQTQTQRIDLEVSQDNAQTQPHLTNAPKIVAVQPPTNHKYGGCPLVALRPVMDDDVEYGSDSQCAPLAEGQKRICNLDSWLHEELQASTFTTTVFLGVSADAVKDVAVGAGQGLALPSMGTTNPAIDTIGSDTTQSDSLRKSLDYEIRELYRVAGLTPGNPMETGAPESGVSKAFAFNEIEAKLAALSDACQYAENTAIKRLSAGFSFAYPGDSDWPDDFASPDLADEITVTIQMQSANLPATLQRAQIERIAELCFHLDGKQKAQFAAELDAQATFTAKQQANPITNPAVRTPGT